MKRWISLLRKAAGLPPAELWLHLRALGALVVTRFGPASPVARPRGSAAVAGSGEAAAPGPVAIGRAIEAAARLVPGATCLTRARAALRLLERHGHRGRLRFGVRRGECGGLAAHAWVQVDDRAVVGGGPAARYVALEPA